MQRSRTMIAAETEAAMAPLLGAQSDAALAQWLAKLQGTLADESKRHKEAQRHLKQVWHPFSFGSKCGALCCGLTSRLQRSFCVTGLCIAAMCDLA